MAGVNGCALMLLLISRHSIESDPVKREVSRAVSRRVPVVQVRLEKVPLPTAMQYMISNLQWVTARPPPLDRHLETIVAEVRTS